MNEKYALEIDDWGQWKFEKDFSGMNTARNYATNHFPQNGWRLIERRTGNVAYTYDPIVGMQTQAAEKLNRFSERDRWRQTFIDRAVEAEQAVERQANRNRLNEVAARQRQENERIRRLAGFEFVGRRPVVQETFWPEDDEPKPQKINWKLEGF